MIVRDAKVTDYRSLVPMAYRFYTETVYTSIPFCARSALEWFQLMSSQGLLAVAEDGGPIVGCLGGLSAPFIANNKYKIGQECLWWVDPEYRDSGVGATLIAHVEQNAKDQGLVIWSMVALEHLDPEKAGAIYNKLGYTKTENAYSKRL